MSRVSKSQLLKEEKEKENQRELSWDHKEETAAGRY